MTKKDELLTVLESLQKALASAEPVTPLRVRLWSATIAFALETADEIQETKRPRRSREARHG